MTAPLRAYDVLGPNQVLSLQSYELGKYSYFTYKKSRAHRALRGCKENEISKVSLCMQSTDLEDQYQHSRDLTVFMVR